ncbi:MAG: hypothetical protein ACYDAQ_18030 [Mycobacteriales bacterium]
MPRDVMSVRVSPDVRNRLQREAARAGEPPASLAERLIEEGLRQRSHPLIRFVDGPTGRRARLIPGPDVWELISFMQRSDALGEDKIPHAAGWFALPASHVEAGLVYYAAFPAEIDQRIRLNGEAQDEAEEIAAGRRRLLG